MILLFNLLKLAFVTNDDQLILDCLFSHLIWSDVMIIKTEIANPRTLPSFLCLISFASLIPPYTALACCLVRIGYAEFPLRRRTLVVSREPVY